jgi:uncharacterized RDD family membrane protein YckC
VDGVILTSLSLLLGGVVAVADVVIDEYAALYLTCGYLILVLMYSATEAWGASTPGKSLGLKVVRHDGRPATRARRICRSAVKQSPLICLAGAVSMLPMSDRGVPFLDWLPFAASVLSQVLALGVMLGFLLVLTPSRTALYDRIAGTAVFRDQDVIRDAGHAFRPLPLQIEPCPPPDDPTTSPL